MEKTAQSSLWLQTAKEVRLYSLINIRGICKFNIIKNFIHIYTLYIAGIFVFNSYESIRSSYFYFFKQIIKTILKYF